MSLQSPDMRDFASSDPNGFLRQYSGGAVLDEIHRTPDLLPHLVELAGNRHRAGRFVLISSEQLRLTQSSSQSLDPNSVLHLLALDMAERGQVEPDKSINEMLCWGFFPRIYDQKLDPAVVYSDYFAAYVERDVRLMGGVENFSAFQAFIRLCAGRIGQLANLSAMASEVGVTQPTADRWMSILERSYIVFQLPPYRANIKKRLVKSRKIYFYDVGLASHLIGIRSPDQLDTHPMRGPLFENAVVMETLKFRFNRGALADLSFYRDSHGLECDLLYRGRTRLAAIEIKSAATINSDFLRPFKRVRRIVPTISSCAVVYGGNHHQVRTEADVLPLTQLSPFLERLEHVQDDDSPADEPVEFGDENHLIVLDRLVDVEVRPLLDQVDRQMRDRYGSQFRATSILSRIHLRNNEFDATEDAFSVATWAKTKDECDLVHTFRLAADESAWLERVYEFDDYLGSATHPFSVRAALRWSLCASRVAFEMHIDEDLQLAVSRRIEHSSASPLATTHATIVRHVLRRFMESLRNRSDGDRAEFI